MPGPEHDEAPAISRTAQSAAIEAAQKAAWMVIKERFCTLEIAVGMRQVDLATRLGVSRAQIHEWMSDHRNLSLKAVARLLAAMDSELVFKTKASAQVPQGRAREWIMALTPLLSFAGQY